MSAVVAIFAAVVAGAVTQVTLTAGGVPTHVAHVASLPVAMIAAALACAVYAKIRRRMTDFGGWS